jgi:16S rRNA (uracil1498-N3)-methyltransferase
MPARRFFVEGVHVVGDIAPIAGADAHKIRNVLRLRSGDNVELIDSAGRIYGAQLVDDGGVLYARLQHEVEAPRASPVAIDLAQALPKGQKMDFIVEKATELGAAAIIPFVCERTIVREISDERSERWRRLAVSASKQSGRAKAPRVEIPVTYDVLLERYRAYDVVLFPWELAPHVSLRESLPALVANVTSVLVVIGPEGGFSHDEADRSAQGGAQLVWLGPNILRTETAGLVVLSILQYVLQ